MNMQLLSHDFTICQIADISGVDFSRDVVFMCKTADEISLVCESSCVPAHTLALQPHWKALKILGTLDFSLIGIIAKITHILAQQGISVFVVSTYNTDYVLAKTKDMPSCLQTLRQHGYSILEPDTIV